MYWTPPGQPQPYQQQYGPGPRRQPTSGLAVASLVLGILWLGWAGSIMAVIFAHVALGNIRHTGQGGHGLAVAGLVLGYIGIATLTMVIVLAAVGAAAGPSGTS